MNDWLSIIPPLLAISFAIWKREVILALLIALWSSETLLSLFNPATGFTASLERIVIVFSDADNTRILIFSLLIGALLAYIKESGGVSAFIQWLSRKKYVDTPRKAGLMTTFVGIIIFIETNMSILTSGILSQSLFDKFNMSRARLAYIIDSTSAPISTLILLNAWGAYLLSLIKPYANDNSANIILHSIPLNFYALITLALVFFTVLSNRVYGPLRHYENKRISQFSQPEITASKIRYMLLPLATMVFGIVFLMGLTGDGDILKGSGSRSVLWSTACAVFVAYLLLRYDKKETHIDLIELGFKGMSKLLPLVCVVLLAIALGASLRELGTGTFVAGLVGDFLPPWLIVPAVFISAGIVSFTTGTSWGTFGLLVPIGMPIADSFGIPAALILSAIIGGGVFGDHCSPISDTTIISSLASGCDHLDHVHTQIPYALTAAGITIVLYCIAGLVA